MFRDDLQEPVPADPQVGGGPAGLPERAFGQAGLQPVLLGLPALVIACFVASSRGQFKFN